MTIAITEEHQEMARVAQGFLQGKNVRAASREMLEAPADKLPAFWQELCELGWTGIHLPEAYGGSEAGLEELVLLIEASGYYLAPGPFLPTVWASAVLNLCADEEVKSNLLPNLANGSSIGAVGLGGNLTKNDDGSVSGSASLVLGGELANLLVLKLGDDMILVESDQDGVTVSNVTNLDPSRRAAEIKLENVKVATNRILADAHSQALRIGRTLAAAEATGGSHACTDMAVEYALIREQFGRTIAHFQAIKHHCANMRVAAEMSTASAWDAARAEQEDQQAEFSSTVAASLALPAFKLCGQLNAQVHGGIGYTWEHDVHLYIRRAAALNAFFSPDDAKVDLTELSFNKVTRSYKIELPPEAEDYRVKVRDFIKEFKKVAPNDQRKELAISGYLVPHWPKPWGLGAGPIEQLVIDQEFKAADVKLPDLSISGWNTLTIAQHGNEEQLDKWILKSLVGEYEFCQLFSEPNAGSDAAAIQSKGVKVDGGWIVNGQKVWTSGAMSATHGFMTVRTDKNARKHEGITMMVIDMKDKGVDIRPLKQVTGMSHFNEIFFDDVFVPDEHVVGPVNDGWKVARATLGNEKVSIGGGMDFAKLMGVKPIALLKKFAREDTGLGREVASLTAREVANRLINLRAVSKAVAGGGPGKEGNITKLVSAELAVDQAEVSCRIVGENTAVLNGPGMLPVMMHLGSRAATIAGGTSEVLRNQIAERILGMPRDPLIDN